MKRILTPPNRGKLIVYRVMFLLVLVLAGLLAAGTLYAFLRPAGSVPLFRIGGGESANTGIGDTGGGVAGVFTGIGRLRIPLAGGSPVPATMVLSIAFPYPPEDRAFTEELASKVGDFRTIAIEYFSSLPAEQAINPDENAAKSEILRRYNASLRLGKIEALYFSDLMVIE
ncbi:MAG: flagellar basal body protein FliL [Treponema sp.]|nr:flagellar basal body protein FliL [Treponema sp.]